MNILMIGPVPPPVGGTTVLFQLLLDELKGKKNLHYVLVNTARNKRNLFSGLIMLLTVCIKLLNNLQKNDIVSYHSSVGGSMKLGPIIYVFCKLYKKPVVFRGFGGNYPAWYESRPGPVKWLFLKTVLAFDVVLFETVKSVEFFKSKARGKVIWYPNSRKFYSTSIDLTNTLNSPKKYIYIGHVKESKGCKLIIEISDKLPAGIIIEVYGPLQEGMSLKDFQGHRAQYGGVLNVREVYKTLSRSDVLLFPTYYEGEGYPGVILEAYACGKPVITTNWKSIPEIVDESSGILVEPGNAGEILSAIEKISTSQNLYNLLSKGAFAKANQFSSKIWTQVFIDIISDLKISKGSTAKDSS